MITKKSAIKIMIFFVAVSLTGCATFKSDLTGKFNSPVAKNFGAEGVSVFFVFSHWSQTKGYDAIPKLDNKFKIINSFDDIFRDALTEFSNISRYSTFTDYASDVNEPERRALKDSLMRSHDFVMKIKFMREKSVATHFLGGVCTTLSISLIPVPYTYSYTVNLDILNSKGQLIKSYNRQSSLTKWVQTFLVFLYPFHPEKRKKEEIYVEFLHDIFRQIETEKVLTQGEN